MVEQRESLQEQPFQVVYILVHPGFTTDHEVIEFLPVEDSKFFSQYLEKAREIAKNERELLIVIPHREVLLDPIDIELYHKLIVDLEKYGSIILSGGVDISDVRVFKTELESALGNKLDRIASTTKFIVFGETAKVCVRDTSNTLMSIYIENSVEIEEDLSY